MSAKTANAPPLAAEEVASLQVSLPQMLDLALGTPEVRIIYHWSYVKTRENNL